MSCFGCINDGSQGSDYSDCWKCNLKNHSFYEEDEEFTEIKKQIRADAIEQILEQMMAYRDAHYYSFSNYDVQKYADGFKNATNTLISMVKQLKEKKNDD